MVKRLLIALVILLQPWAVHAQASWSEPNRLIVLVSLWVALLSVIVIAKKEFGLTYKKTFFWLISVPVLLVTLYLAGHTIYENIQSVTKGPVHWHTDYHIYVCGEKLDLVDPKFPKNKIGTPLFHEHNDDRVHVEGSVATFQDVDFESFIRVVGGTLEPGHLMYPTNDGIVDKRDGEYCPDGSVGTLKVYVNGKRMDNFMEYVPYPDVFVPPADCVIVTFDASSADTTDILCESWEVNGWTYDSYERPVVEIGGKTWQ